MEKPSFSIIVSNYNKESFLQEMMNSVLNQFYDNFELIIIDDFSIDNSVETLQIFERLDRRIRLYNNKSNRGANFCRNLGVSKARNDFLIFLDSDDVLSKDCLSNRAREIKQHPEKDLWVFSMKTFKGDTSNIISEWNPPCDDLLTRFLSHRLPWTITQPVWNRNFFVKIGGFDESFMRFQDVELHTKAMLNQAKVYISKMPADCYYRIDESRIINHETHFHNFTSSSIQFFNKFYQRVENKNALFITLLYVIDNIWFAKKTGKLNNEFSENLVNKILDGAIVVSNDLKRINLLKKYWNFKTKLRFNLMGMRYICAKLIE